MNFSYALVLMSLPSTIGVLNPYNSGGHLDIFEDNVILSKTPQRIEVITDCKEGDTATAEKASEKALFRGAEKTEAGNTIVEAGEAGSKRCAASLYPPSAKSMDLPPVTYTFWKCGLGSKDGCTCGIRRVVHAPHNEMVGMNIGEYLSENACNAQCAREAEDKCWVCVEEFYGPWPNPQWAYHFCQHKADAPFSYLGTPGMTQAQCNGRFVCPKLEELPYQFTKYP